MLLRIFTAGSVTLMIPGRDRARRKRRDDPQSGM
jgi:hypothetical protein